MQRCEWHRVLQGCSGKLFALLKQILSKSVTDIPQFCYLRVMPTVKNMLARNFSWFPIVSSIKSIRRTSLPFLLACAAASASSFLQCWLRRSIRGARTFNGQRNSIKLIHTRYQLSYMIFLKEKEDKPHIFWTEKIFEIFWDLFLNQTLITPAW